jgi:hypothetical protein
VEQIHGKEQERAHLDDHQRWTRIFLERPLLPNPVAVVVAEQAIDVVDTVLKTIPKSCVHVEDWVVVRRLGRDRPSKRRKRVSQPARSHERNDRRKHLVERRGDAAEVSYQLLFDERFVRSYWRCKRQLDVSQALNHDSWVRRKSLTLWKLHCDSVYGRKGVPVVDSRIEAHVVLVRYSLLETEEVRVG